MKSKYWYTYVLGSALSLALAGGLAHAQTVEAVNPNIQGDGTLSSAAAAAMQRGPLPMNDAAVAAKAATTRAAVADEKSAAPSTGLSPEAGGNAPLVVGGHSFAGQNAGSSSPSDATGAIGPSSYIQMINTSARIINRSTHASISTATLNVMAGQASTVNSFDPQIIWDPTTNRFYYVMDSVFSSTDHKLSFGFSKTSNPTNFTTTHWCKYQMSFGARFPDYPKLGDSHFFIIIGVNSFQGSFVGSDIIAISKPPAGTTCPAASSFKTGKKLDIRESTPTSARTFTPVPSNQVDTNTTGYVVAQQGLFSGATKLFFYNVTRNSTTGLPIFGNGRALTVASYSAPPDASQPTFTQLLDTLDGRPTQAVQALNPDRFNNIQSFWVQHTVKQTSLNLAEVRWYEINPAPAVPVLLRSGKINTTTSHLYNAAISPDRRRDGATLAFGDSFVIHYNVSGSASGISPRIVAGSSFNGGAVSFGLIRNAVGPFRDFTCPSPGQTCRWGDYAQASPDPRPTFAGRGQVWGTSNYSGVAAPSTSASNFRTWIFDLRP